MSPKRIEPGPGQESVWDYPRPPRVEAINKHISIVFNNVTLVDSRHSKRVLETSHPPVYYIPQEDIKMEYLIRTDRETYCEWKGEAIYYSLQVGDRRVANVAWSYPRPTRDFLIIKDHLAFYPQYMDGCHVNGERVEPQPGGFYGGWITKDIVGPFKGGEGSWGW